MSEATPVVFGEVLFDCFSDGRTLGGAPFNVAWHLQGFGHPPLMISRVGRDAMGDEILARMQDWGMRTEGIQLDDAHATGTVKVTLEAGEPSYDIEEPRAWDAIDADELPVVRPAVLYHGSLALRNEPPRRALDKLRTTGARRFVDVNLRDPHWARDTVRTLLHGAHTVKLNQHELETLGDGDLARFAGDLDLARLVLTCGDAGAQLWQDGETHRVDVPEHGAVVDTVGAGDAFAAVMIVGELRGWSPDESLARAARFAARIVTVRGAIPSDRSLYDEALDGAR